LASLSYAPNLQQAGNGEVLGLVLRDDEGRFSLERKKNSIGFVTMLG